MLAAGALCTCCRLGCECTTSIGGFSATLRVLCSSSLVWSVQRKLACRTCKLLVTRSNERSSPWMIIDQMVVVTVPRNAHVWRLDNATLLFARAGSGVVCRSWDLRAHQGWVVNLAEQFDVEKLLLDVKLFKLFRGFKCIHICTM